MKKCRIQDNYYPWALYPCVWSTHQQLVFEFETNYSMAKTIRDFFMTHRIAIIIILAALISIGTVQALFSLRKQAYDEAFPTVDIGYGIFRGYHNQSRNLNYFNGSVFMMNLSAKFMSVYDLTAFDMLLLL